MAEVKQLACELPATTGVPLSRWSCAELARELVTRAVVAAISAATVWRILHTDAIRPWFHRSWIFPRDPNFATKAAVALDLYARVFESQALGPNEFVVCADEKTSIQARCRCHPTLPPGRARMMRVEHEYDRGGALAYLAAYDVHRAKVSGRCEDTTGIVPFGRLVEQVMTAEPYASAERVFWIVDNGSSHRGKRSIDRLEGEWPTLRLIHLPVHASWLDQCEIYFSIVQRKVVNPNDFTDLDQIRDGSPRSRTATTRWPHPSTGSSAATISTSSSPASTPTRRRPRKPNPGSGRCLPSAADAHPRRRPPRPGPAS